MLLRRCLPCHKVNLQDEEKAIINSYMLPLPIFYEAPLNCSEEKQVTKKILKHSREKFRFVNMVLVGTQLLVEYGDIYGTIATAKMELSLCGISSFQPLSNFARNPNIGAMGVLNALLNCNLELF